MLSTKQTAERLGVHEKTIFLWAKQGKILGKKIGRNFKFMESEVEYILQNGTREPNCHLADTKQA